MRARSLAFICLILIPTALASAQQPQTRQGFGISFGFGTGSAGATCSDCSTDRTSGLSGYLRLGGYISPNVFLAGESNGWLHSEDGVDETLGYYTAVAQWYPSPTSGFYLKGGLGLFSYLATDGSDEVSGSAAAMSIGTGFDARVGTNFSLTPFLNYLWSAEGELKVNSISSGVNLAPNVLQVGLGFTWH